MAKQANNLVLFDGVCALCNNSVKFLVRIDKTRKLRYAPLQGETTQAMLKKQNIAFESEDFKSMIFIKNPGGEENENWYNRSDAVLEILINIGGIWKGFYIFKVIPVAWRNWLYNFIAKNRYKWFGKYETCRLPVPQERDLFLP